MTPSNTASTVFAPTCMRASTITTLWWRLSSTPYSTPTAGAWSKCHTFSSESLLHNQQFFPFIIQLHIQNNHSHSLFGISFFTLNTFRKEAGSEDPKVSQQNTFDLTKLAMGGGSASTTVLMNSGDYSLSLWQRFLKVVIYLPFFSILAYSLLAIVYSLQFKFSYSWPPSSLPESTEELSLSSASPQSSSAMVLIFEQALQRTCATREKHRLHSWSPSPILPLLSSRSMKTLATTCLSAVVEQTSAVRRILTQRWRLCSFSARLPLRLTWQRQTSEMESSFPTQGTDLAATMPLLDRLARKVWMHSVRAHQAGCPRGVKRVLMAMRFTYATFSMMASRSYSQLELSSSSLSSCMSVVVRQGARSSTSQSLRTMRLTRIPKRQCIWQSRRLNSSKLTALSITCCRIFTLTALFSCANTTMRRRNMSMGSATCHTSSSLTFSSKNWRLMKRSGNSQQVRTACRRAVILLFMRVECGMAAPQNPQISALIISQTSTRMAIGTPLYSQ